jgi:dynein heavy chain
VWDQDKEAYMRRYEKAQKPLSSYDNDILGYKATQEEVGGSDLTACGIGWAA